MIHSLSHKRLAIIQPAYIPWKGYFDFIASVDQFVFFDDVDYVKRTWYSRNCLKHAGGGTKWLSIPVDYSQSNPTAINRTPISSAFAESHLDFIKANYAKAPFFDTYFPAFCELLTSLERGPYLSDVTMPLVRWLAEQLGITTPMHKASDTPVEGKSSQRLVKLCLQYGATHYVSGPAAKAYLDESLFAEHGINVEWMDYSGYPDYPQLHGAFEHGVSVLDLLWMTGSNAPDYMKHDKQAV